MTDQQAVWKRRRKIKGSIVISTTFRGPERIELDRLKRAYGVRRRQDVLRLLVSAAAAAHAEAGDAKRTPGDSDH